MINFSIVKFTNFCACLTTPEQGFHYNETFLIFTSVIQKAKQTITKYFAEKEKLKKK